MEKSRMKPSEFALWTLLSGAALALSVYILGVAAELLCGSFGNYFTMKSISAGAFETAPGIIVTAFLVAFISELVIKNKEKK